MDRFNSSIIYFTKIMVKDTNLEYFNYLYNGLSDIRKKEFNKVVESNIFTSDISIEKKTKLLETYICEKGVERELAELIDSIADKYEDFKYVNEDDLLNILRYKFNQLYYKIIQEGDDC